MRETAAMASASVKSPGSMVRPMSAHRCLRTNEFFRAKAPVFVGEADSAVKLWGAGHLFSMPGMPMRMDGHGVFVVVVPDLFQGGRFRRNEGVLDQGHHSVVPAEYTRPDHLRGYLGSSSGEGLRTN